MIEVPRFIRSHELINYEIHLSKFLMKCRQIRPCGGANYTRATRWRFVRPDSKNACAIGVYKLRSYI